jgi:CMP-N-acetylneuraminic acid synthetase
MHAFLSSIVKAMSDLNAFWTAVIPLRGGSKGLPRKNTRLLAGQPLYQHAIDTARQAGAQRIIISTDIREILDTSHPADIQIIERPAHLCGDDVPMAPVLAQALQAARISGAIALLQATSPLRSANDISSALSLLATGQFELIMSVTEAERSVLKWGHIQGDRFLPLSDPAYCFANRQALPAVYRPNGAVYAMQAAWFLDRASFVTERLGVITMAPERSLDIDSLTDFERCESMFKSIQSLP